MCDKQVFVGNGQRQLTGTRAAHAYGRVWALAAVPHPSLAQTTAAAMRPQNKASRVHTTLFGRSKSRSDQSNMSRCCTTAGTSAIRQPCDARNVCRWAKAARAQGW
jgi:hypothetical protein